MRERLKSIAFFTKLWWYSIWDWAGCYNCEFRGDHPDKYGDGTNIHWEATIIYIDTTTRWYLLKKLLYKLKRSIKPKEATKCH